jgi:anti-sigma B factor antagonist
MAGMRVTRSDRDGVAVLRLEGEFDSFETELVREAFEGCLQSGKARVVLDLSGLKFANSTTIAYFITAQKRAKAQGGMVVLAAAGDFIRKTLRTLGLDQVFAYEETVGDAVASLGA